MKLGTETGSVMNHLYSRMTKGQPVPEVGMGATILHWTDRTAATIITVQTTEAGGWIIAVQEDIATVTSGSTFDGSAVYAYTPDPCGALHYYRFDAGRGWRGIEKTLKGRWRLTGESGLVIGQRQAYRDPSF